LPAFKLHDAKITFSEKIIHPSRGRARTDHPSTARMGWSRRNKRRGRHNESVLLRVSIRNALEGCILSVANLNSVRTQTHRFLIK